MTNLLREFTGFTPQGNPHDHEHSSHEQCQQGSNPTAGNKPKQGKQESELNFNDLFSSAMGQSAPNAQLNSIENQLRESLYKQDKPKKQ